MKINELYDQTFWNDKNSIVILWHIDDVKSIRPDLSDEQCMEVLNMVARNHDAEAGVNWGVIEYWIDELFGTPLPLFSQLEEEE